MNQLHKSILLLLIVPIVLTAGEPQSNIVIFNKLADDIFNRFIAKTGIDSNVNVILQNSEPAADGDWFIEQLFISKLNKQHIDSIVVLPHKVEIDTIGQRHAVFIKYKIAELAVRYISHDSFWTRKPIDRRIDVNIRTRVTRLSDGLLIHGGFFPASYSDKINWQDISKIENPRLAFTTAPKPAYSGFKKYINPIFIMGVSGIIIYLFYSFRSN